jgi:DNA transposition AAA+ family ATPase
MPDEALSALIGVRTIFYTTPVVNTPKQINDDIVRLRSQLKSLAKEPLRCEAAQKLKQIIIRDNRHAEEMFTTHDRLSEPMPKLKPTYAAISRKYAAKEKSIGDPMKLILVDEADRLKMASLEQIRAIFDAGGIGLEWIGMLRLEKRLARYPQFYSRMGLYTSFAP